MTKLAASRDVAAYAGLEASSQTVNQVSMPFQPLDDESVARGLQNQYTHYGYDPNLALARNEMDPLEDFGGTAEFMK